MSEWRQEDENEPEQTQTWYSPVLLEHGLCWGWSKSRMVDDGVEEFAVSPDAITAYRQRLAFSYLSSIKKNNTKGTGIKRKG